MTELTYSKCMGDYYYKALASIPKDHSHRDELIVLLIDQVLDDMGHANFSTN